MNPLWYVMLPLAMAFYLDATSVSNMPKSMEKMLAGSHPKHVHFHLGHKRTSSKSSSSTSIKEYFTQLNDKIDNYFNLLNQKVDSLKKDMENNGGQAAISNVNIDTNNVQAINDAASNFQDWTFVENNTPVVNQPEDKKRKLLDDFNGLNEAMLPNAMIIILENAKEDYQFHDEKKEIQPLMKSTIALDFRNAPAIVKNLFTRLYHPQIYNTYTDIAHIRDYDYINDLEFLVKMCDEHIKQFNAMYAEVTDPHFQAEIIGKLHERKSAKTSFEKMLRYLGITTPGRDFVGAEREQPTTGVSGLQLKTGGVRWIMENEPGANNNQPKVLLMNGVEVPTSIY